MGNLTLDTYKYNDPLAFRSDPTLKHYDANSFDPLVQFSDAPEAPKWSFAVVPKLSDPTTFDIEGLNALLGQLDEAITKEQVSTGTESIKADQNERKAKSDQVKEQMRIAQEKAEEAAKVAEQQRIAGWCQAIFGLIGAAFAVVAAVAATGLTFGATVGLGVLAGAGLVMAIQDVTNMGLKEAKTPVTLADGTTKQADCSFGGMIDAIVAQQIADGTIVEIRQDADGNYLDKKGNIIQDPHLNAKAGALLMTTKELDDWKLGWTIATTLVIAVAMIAGGVGVMKHAEKAATKAIEAGKAFSSNAMTAERVGEGVSVGAQVVEGATSISSGAMGIKLAEINRDTDKARAAKAYYENMIKEIGQRMSMTQDMVRELITRLDEIFDQMSANVAGASTNLTTIARNVA